ncbi:unnamed protein product, partial [Pylaiella littoralis]
QDDELDFDDEEDDYDSGTNAEAGGRGDGSGTGSRPKSTGTAHSSSSSSRGMFSGVGAGAGMLVVPADVEEAVKREIESATGSRLAQVEGALLELSRKQAELESREKQFNETSSSLVVGITNANTTAATAATAPVPVPDGEKAGEALVASSGVG